MNGIVWVIGGSRALRSSGGISGEGREVVDGGGDAGVGAGGA